MTIPKTLGVLLFPDFELLDVFGPLEMFGQLEDNIKILLMAQKSGPVISAAGPQVIAEVDLANAPKIDFLLVPGGMGTRTEIHNTSLIEWIKNQALQTELILSVCTGAALLAKAGILDNRQATSNKLAFDWVVAQGPQVQWVKHARWVVDGNIVTSSGVAAGIDMSLAVIEKLFGTETSHAIATKTEYQWNADPHHDLFAK